MVKQKVKQKASEEILSELHGVVAQTLINRLSSGDCSPSDINNAIKFLKDNGIVTEISEQQGNPDEFLTDNNELPFQLVQNLKEF